MKVCKNSDVSKDYTLTDEAGELVDSSEDSGPLAYIQGTGSIIPGLEAALEGKSQGDKVMVTVTPDDAYGERDENLVQAFPKSQFEEPELLEIGMQFELQTDDEPTVVSVVDVNDKEVVVDGNHPLAGMTLKFDVTVRGVREATAEELSHGHVHGPEGHHH